MAFAIAERCAAKEQFNRSKEWLRSDRLAATSGVPEPVVVDAFRHGTAHTRNIVRTYTSNSRFCVSSLFHFKTEDKQIRELQT